MSLESSIVRLVIRWLWAKYPWQCRDIIVGEGRHIQGSRKKKRAT